MGWLGSARAMKRSTSAALIAVIRLTCHARVGGHPVIANASIIMMMTVFTGSPPSRGRQPQVRREYSGPSHEERRQAVADLLRDHLGGTVLGVTLAARAGEALLLAGNIEGHARKCPSGEHRLAGLEIDQRVGGVDAIVLDLRPCAVDVDDHLQLGGGKADVEPVVGRRGCGAAGEAEDQLIAYL